MVQRTITQLAAMNPSVVRGSIPGRKYALLPRAVMADLVSPLVAFGPNTKPRAL